MSWQKCKLENVIDNVITVLNLENVIDNVITVLNLQEPIEKRFIVNYVQKVSEQEKALKTWRGNSCRILWRSRIEEIVNPVLKASKQERSFGSIKKNYMQSKSFSFHQVILQKMQIQTIKVA